MAERQQLESLSCLPIWSRLRRRNACGKLHKFDIEIAQRLWSLWGNLQADAPCFAARLRGHQYLAIYVVACCAASVYSLMDWSAQLLDTIVVMGSKYYEQSIKQIKRRDYEFSLENLLTTCALESLKFVVHLELVCYGKLYCQPKASRMNLSTALIYFFAHYQFGIIMLRKRALAIGCCPGHSGGYFMYDCQAKERPLFPNQQGASYMLRTPELQLLLECIVITLNGPQNNINFSIHTVEMLEKG